MTRWVMRAVLGSVGLALAACGSAGTDAAGAGDFGATPGGVKDMSLARELVEQGMVPPAEAFLVEGMYAEHDLPLEGTPCNTILCTRGAVGVAPDETGASRAWVQVGLSSSIDPETYVRPALGLVFVVDVSGSMQWGYDNGASGGAIATALLEALTSDLGPEDRVAFVAFDDSRHDVLGPTPGDQQSTIAGAIADLEDIGGGGTDIQAGLRRGYQIAEVLVEDLPYTRVVLVTDAHPNVGATSTTDFDAMVAAGAEDGVGLSVIGTGLGLGVELFAEMAEHRGANAFSVMDTDDVAPLMEESWPWMFVPIAYDFALRVRPAVGYEIEADYGFPGDPEEGEVTTNVATVFLSRKRGALVLEVAPVPQESISSVNASIRLDYVELDGTEMHDELSPGYSNQPLDAEGRYFPQPGLARAVALGLLVTAMHDAAEVYDPADPAAALARLQPARERFVSDAAAIGDGAIDPEIAFTDALLTLIQNGAPQGTLYPY